MLPVVPAQQFTLGQALPSGVVLLDVSIAGNPRREITAFTLAHEYAHQVMGHAQLYLTEVGRWLVAAAGTAHEDEADAWAAEFMRSANYDIAPVLAFLCRLPGGGPGDSHSTGPARARNVARAFGAGMVPCRGEHDDESSARTHEVRLRIWSRAEGNPASMDVEIDGEYIGSISNIYPGSCT
jgi:hypothetical protein